MYFRIFTVQNLHPQGVMGGSKMNKTVEEKTEVLGARIKVIGAGGGGTNAVNYMIEVGSCPNVEYYAVNTDAQHLNKSRVKPENRILLATKDGKRVGLGAGSRPEVGRDAAEAAREVIMKALEGADMVYIAGGMGGGTGTGVAPVVAEIAKSMDILVVAVITMPYGWEGKKRWSYAVEGRRALLQSAHTVITVNNDSLTVNLDSQGVDIALDEAFKQVDNVLNDGVKGIVDIIEEEGVMNLDYADVETVLKHEGPSLMGIGYSDGANRVEEATWRAIENPLLGRDIRGAKGVILSVSGKKVQYKELIQAGNIVSGLIDPDATLITGSSTNPNAKDGELRVTIIATGFPEDVIDEEYPGFDGSGARSLKSMTNVQVDAPSKKYGESVSSVQGNSSLDSVRSRLQTLRESAPAKPSWMQK